MGVAQFHRGLVGFLKLSVFDENDDPPGGKVEFVFARMAEGTAAAERGFGGLRGDGRRLFIFGEAALLVFLATAAATGLIASDLGHFLQYVGEDGHLYQSLLADANFHQQLLACDRDLAATAQAARCLICGGALHVADYRRKPRGHPAALGEEYCWRFSFCCAVDGCRARMTPVSLRFLGRRVYLGMIVILVCALRDGLSDRRLDKLATIGVDRRTVGRWRDWWLNRFTATPFWRVAAAAFMPPADPCRLPASLLERFGDDPAGRLISCLRFLAPLTGGAAMRHAI